MLKLSRSRSFVLGDNSLFCRMALFILQLFSCMLVIETDGTSMWRACDEQTHAVMNRPVIRWWEDACTGPRLRIRWTCPAIHSYIMNIIMIIIIIMIIFPVDMSDQNDRLMVNQSVLLTGPLKMIDLNMETMARCPGHHFGLIESTDIIQSNF